MNAKNEFELDKFSSFSTMLTAEKSLKENENHTCDSKI